MRSRLFTFNGRELEIVAIVENNYWLVTIREGGHTVGCVEYRVSLETTADALHYSNAPDLVEHLMNIAQRDVEDELIGVRARPV